jgi:hypothetical protein
METDPLKKLTDFYKSEGFTGREAVEKAEAELERRHQSAGKNHLLLSFVPPSLCTLLFRIPFLQHL